MATTRKPAAIFIFITLVLAIMGIGLILPVLPGLVTEFEGGDVAQASHVYGWLVGIFAMMQLLGSPILGALSDRFGRRRVILVSLAGVRDAGLDDLRDPRVRLDRGHRRYVTRHVPPNEQGSLQGAFGSLLSVAGIVAPPVAAWSFGWAIDPANTIHLPGIPFFLGAALLVVALVIAVQSFRRKSKQAAVAAM
ncbi:MAG TPA: MFS transporter [Opitutaceae bacterium]|nr:MFS transporter [Opitutaceae bacterium]